MVRVFQVEEKKKVATIDFEIPQGVSSDNYHVIKSEGNQGVNKSDDGDLIIYFEEKSLVLELMKFFWFKFFC